jgi:AraC-like DNA-binding protein
VKLALEKIKPDFNSSFRLLLSPGLNDYFLWHFHPEYEIVYVEGESGIRHIGDHISRYQHSDLVFIGPNIPHLNFDYGVKTHCDQVVVQMKENFLGPDFLALPELEQVRVLFEKARGGLCFYGETKKAVGEKLKGLACLDHFDQLISLLSVFQLLATSSEVERLNSRPLSNERLGKEQLRMNCVYRFIEEHYHEDIEVKQAAALCHLSMAAFCRYFRKISSMTFTEFVNRYRISQAKNVLLSDKNVTEACFESGFENPSYFTKTFRRLVGENPSQFKKRHLTT